MRSGDLDRTIQLQSATQVDDGYGNITETWTTKATMRAQLVSDETLIIFRTRWIDGVTLADRTVYNGLIHNIKSVKEIGRRRGLEIRTVSLGEAAT